MARSLLDALEPSARQALLADAHRRTYERRETIFHRDEPGDSLLLVERGRVAVQVVTPTGATATLAIVSPGEVLGELAVIDPVEPRSADAVAIEETTVLAFHRDTIERVRATSRSVDTFLLHVLTAKVRRTSQLLVEALHLPAEPRVRRRVTELVEAYADADRAVEVPLTQDEIAQLAGTSRATVNRVLRAAEEQGLVAIERGRTIVPAPERIGVRRRGRSA